ncbi:hypothetical protein SDC9_178027 [bioreactor metagenome]|uniref:Uncharacterized protein n=1 Tax=bioreactor metagenome TaxID=1076179 RepID=A0A645GWB9_9ZZZZ
MDAVRQAAADGYLVHIGQLGKDTAGHCVLIDEKEVVPFIYPRGIHDRLIGVPDVSLHRELSHTEKHHTPRHNGGGDQNGGQQLIQRAESAALPSFSLVPSVRHFGSLRSPWLVVGGIPVSAHRDGLSQIGGRGL